MKRRRKRVRFAGTELEIPFIDFGGNPLGVMIGVFMFFMLLLYFANTSFGPFSTNATFTTEFNRVYTNLKWLGILITAFLPIAIVIGYMQLQQQKERAGPVPVTTEPVEEIEE